MVSSSVLSSSSAEGTSGSEKVTAAAAAATVVVAPGDAIATAGEDGPLLFGIPLLRLWDFSDEHEKWCQRKASMRQPEYDVRSNAKVKGTSTSASVVLDPGLVALFVVQTEPVSYGTR